MTEKHPTTRDLKKAIDHLIQEGFSLDERVFIHKMKGDNYEILEIETFNFTPNLHIIVKEKEL